MPACCYAVVFWMYVSLPGWEYFLILFFSNDGGKGLGDLGILTSHQPRWPAHLRINEEGLGGGVGGGVGVNISSQVVVKPSGSLETRYDRILNNKVRHTLTQHPI